MRSSPIAWTDRGSTLCSRRKSSCKHWPQPIALPGERQPCPRPTSSSPHHGPLGCLGQGGRRPNLGVPVTPVRPPRHGHILCVSIGPNGVGDRQSEGGAMDPSEFKASKAGSVVTCPEGYAAFVPAPLPPELTFTRELAVALSRADAALGKLSGLAGELPNPPAMVAPFLRQEALCSPRMEGAGVSLAEVLLDGRVQDHAELDRTARLDAGHRHVRPSAGAGDARRARPPRGLHGRARPAA